MKLKFKLENIQHVKKVEIEFDLTSNKLTCLVGKNGVGKTTLIKAIRNFNSADTFKKTSLDNIFNEQSYIEYCVNDDSYHFRYDSDISSINSSDIIPDTLKKQVDVELPMPFGERFNFFQSISNSDSEIRRAIVLDDYKKPTDLIIFLNEIYSSNKFDELIEVTIKGVSYYCILLDDYKYIREDYLSSGEFFLISLFRKIQNKCKFIVIDELDISLDAAAQVHLINKLRIFCSVHQVNIAFTTHSLALMQTLKEDELYYMNHTQGDIEIVPASYNYIKSILFGFNGWDKYILTEDKVLHNFLEHVIKKYCDPVFFEYKIIYIGGATQVVDLMRRNETENFLTTAENILCVLDGDQKELRHTKLNDNVHCIPLESVEKELLKEYHDNPSVISRLPDGINVQSGKQVYKGIIRNGIMSEEKIFEHLIQKFGAELETFYAILNSFLSNTLTEKS